MNRFYIESVNKAIEFIEDNINKKISLNAIAEASGVSKFHFHRIFQAFTDESVYDAVIRLRVEKGAGILHSNPNLTIAEVARETGFSDSSGFSRAFRERFSISPSAWRKDRNQKDNKTQPEKKLLKNKKSSNTGPKAVSTEIKELDEFTIAYLRHTGAYAGDTALFIYLYNKLTAWAASEDLLRPERYNIVVYHDPVKITEDPRIKISLGISVPEDIKMSRDIGKMKLRGGSYLICRYSLRDEEYPEAWKQVYRHWLTHYGLKPVDGFCFESYPADVKSKDKYSSIVDICVPVEKL